MADKNKDHKQGAEECSSQKQGAKKEMGQKQDTVEGRTGAKCHARALGERFQKEMGMESRCH